MKKNFIGLCWCETSKPYFHLKDFESGVEEYTDTPQEFFVEKVIE